MLPEHFLERMQRMLGEEYPAFLNSYEQAQCRSLRFNPLKGEQGEFLEKQPFHLRSVAWEHSGFYYEEEDRPGRHPWHEAGVYYIQDASAMLPAGLLDARPGERILDLCAAPGGKSTQLAADMQGSGILVCNEIHAGRARILSANIERMGITNAVVLNESPQHLAEVFPAYFDRILVDAPCSGEGMFRKNEEACGEWSLEAVEACAARQDEILESAAIMLRPGGRLVYSTCTFALAENEGAVARFLACHPGWELLPIEKRRGMADGVAQWAQRPESGAVDRQQHCASAGQGLERTVRLFPHRLEGEGHFAALLQKEASRQNGRGQSMPGNAGEVITRGDGTKRSQAKGNQAKGNPVGENRPTDYADYRLFCRQTLQPETLRRQEEGRLLLFGEQLYLAPEGLFSLNGLRVLRPGLHLGTLKKNRFEPSHALALALDAKEARRVWNLSSREESLAYLNGRTFQAQGEAGWYLITVDGYSIGWGKLAGNTMKNHYPKGLRINL